MRDSEPCTQSTKSWAFHGGTLGTHKVRSFRNWRKVVTARSYRAVDLSFAIVKIVRGSSALHSDWSYNFIKTGTLGKIDGTSALLVIRLTILLIRERASRFFFQKKKKRKKKKKKRRKVSEFKRSSFFQLCRSKINSLIHGLLQIKLTNCADDKMSLLFDTLSKE